MSAQRLGATCIVMENFDAVAALELIERYRVTHSQWVPTMFVRMLKLPEAERRRHDVSSLRIAVHAAAPCPVPVKEQMIEWWGPVLYEYYAGTEGNGFTSINSAGLAGAQGIGRAPAQREAPHPRRRGQGAAARQPGGIYFEGGPSSSITTRPRRRPAPARGRAGARSATSATSTPRATCT